MQTLRNIGIIGRITMLEGARKQVFHVLMLFAVFLIFGSATLAKFDRHVQMKMLNDLCLFSVFLVSSIVAITITVTGRSRRDGAENDLPCHRQTRCSLAVYLRQVRRGDGDSRYRHGGHGGGLFIFADFL